jgi:hypothetical protein
MLIARGPADKCVGAAHTAISFFFFLLQTRVTDSRLLSLAHGIDDDTPNITWQWQGKHTWKWKWRESSGARS